MPCETKAVPGGGFAIVCSRGRRSAPCLYCGKPSSRLCDYPTAGAVAPPSTPRTCDKLAGSRPGDLVLDPFAGSGTVGVVALRHGFLGLELNPAYCEMARRRIAGPLFAEATP